MQGQGVVLHALILRHTCGSSAWASEGVLCSIISVGASPGSQPQLVAM